MNNIFIDPANVKPVTKAKKPERKWRNPIELFLQLLKPKTLIESWGLSKKEPTDFVKRMRAIDKRAAVKNVLWDSQRKGTYSRAKHGELIGNQNTMIVGDSKC